MPFWFVSEGIFLTKESKFCIKRTENFTLKNVDGRCPENHRECGEGCVPTKDGVSCPLNFQEVSTDEFTATSRNILQLNGNIKHKFSVKSVENSPLPFVNLVASSGKGVCYDPKTAPSFASNTPYPYERQQESGCKSNEIDTIDFEELD